VLDDSGQQVPWDGKTFGELQVRGPWITRSYYHGGDDNATLDALRENTRTSPDEQAAFRHDFSSWLSRYSPRYQRIALDMALGHRTSDLAHFHRCSPARISQLRREFHADWQQFRASASEVVGPVLNFVYADIAGNIGYQDVGRVPQRRAGDGTLPVEGQDDRFEWHGDVAFDALPHALNPPDGLIATANNNLAAAKRNGQLRTAIPLTLTAFSDAPYRVHRIYQLLSLRKKSTPEQKLARKLPSSKTAKKSANPKKSSVKT